MSGPATFKLAVTGGRDYRDASVISRALDLFVPHNPELIVGDASGADAIAAKWATFRGWKVRVFRADWEKHGKGAGPIRNGEMIAENPHVLLAFHGGRGTENCVMQAKKAGIPVLRVEP